MIPHRSLILAKQFLVLAAFIAGLAGFSLRAEPVTVSYDFNFEWNTFYPTEKVTGNLTLTVEPPPAAFTGYTMSGATLDAFQFQVAGLGLVESVTNYVKMLFISGKMTYLLISDRSDFQLSAIPPKKAGYILAIQGDDLLAGTGVKYGSFGSTFSYYLESRRGVDIVYTDDKNDVIKVANPLPPTPPTPPAATVPDTASTLGLFSAALLTLTAARRRFLT